MYLNKIPFLKGMVDLPFATPTGRIVTDSGYDEATQIILKTDHTWSPVVPAKPSADDVRAALSVMLSPFLSYKFAGPDDAAGLIGSVFAALCRSSLDKCPMVAVDAAVQGSGKTKLALALGALIEGETPAVMPYSGAHDEEISKLLLTWLHDQRRFLCIDNVTGHFKSAALSGLLTSGKVSGRILGKTGSVVGDAAFMVTCTANNVSIDADLQRRTVTIRIESGAAPTQRAFAFDPVRVALRRRREIAVAACTVWQAYFNAGSPDIAADSAGGFDEWVKLCRQPLLWAVQEGLTDGLPWVVGDPAGSMLADASQSDPELLALGSLLYALREAMGDRPFTSAEVYALYRSGDGAGPDSTSGRVHEAVVDMLYGRRDATSTTIGKVLRNRRDREVPGIGRLAAGGKDAGNVTLWRVIGPVLTGQTA